MRICLLSYRCYRYSGGQGILINLRKLDSSPNLIEWLGVCTGFFTEPLTFGMRVYSFLRSSNGNGKYDIIHDNQSLSHSILKIKELGTPVVPTIHHPITIDRDLAIKAAKSLWQKMGIRRWYAFANMQLKVAKKLSHFITGSQNSYREIIDTFKLPEYSLRVIYDGVDSSTFTQAPGRSRLENRLLVISSGDTPLNGLKTWLEAC